MPDSLPPPPAQINLHPQHEPWCRYCLYYCAPPADGHCGLCYNKAHARYGQFVDGDTPDCPHHTPRPATY